MNKLIDLLFELFDYFFFLKGKFVHKDGIMIIPHSGMCSVDHYDIINYKSDSALSFLNYLLINNLQTSKRIFVAISDNVDTDRYVKYIQNNFPNRNIYFIKTFLTKKHSKIDKIRIRIRYNNSII